MELVTVALAVPALVVAVVVVAWVVKDPVRGLYMAIFASGILFPLGVPGAGDRFAATEALMLLTWGAVLVWALMGGRLARGRLHPTQQTALLWGGLLTATAVTSFLVNTLGTSGARFHSAMMETGAYVYGYLTFATVVLLVDDKRKLQGCVTAWLLSAAVVAAVGVWALIGGAPAWTRDEFSRRISSTLRFENQVPSHLMPIFAVAAVYASLRAFTLSVRLVYAALTCAMVLVLMGTGSRTAAIMLVLAFLAVFYIATRHKQGRALKLGMLYAIGAALAVGLAVFTVQVYTDQSLQYRLGEIPPHLRPVLLLRSHAEEGAGIGAREREYALVAQHFLDRPLVGTGPAYFFEAYRSNVIHNTYLQVLMQQGVPGLVALLGWLLVVFRCGATAGRSTDDRELRLLITCLLTGFLLLLVYNIAMFGMRQRSIWFAAGLLAALPRVVWADLVARAAPVPAPPSPEKSLHVETRRRGVRSPSRRRA